MKKIFLIAFYLLSINCFSQSGFPWERPLKIAWSADGTTFSNTTIFQDSSGVPSAIRWKSDTLVCAFQWFRQPMNSPSWDRVAVKFSYDAGLTWSEPTPIVVNGIPSTYQRPFDPTLAVVNNDSLRIYFSSSDGMPVGGLDSSINTYSASSTDGVNFTFEPNARFDHPTNRVIDPAIIYFDSLWNYAAPIGAPQAGAYHCTGSDGITFTQQSDYTSDMTHNWTGNFMVNDTNELRFYGSGQKIWFNSSSDGISWQGYVNTNINGGDPSAIRIGSSNYLIIYVGEPYLNNIEDDILNSSSPHIFQENDLITVVDKNIYDFKYCIYSLNGSMKLSGNSFIGQIISLSGLKDGIYFLTVESDCCSQTFKLNR